MTSFPNSPRLIKGGLVLVNPETLTVERIISLQYNPESLSRTLQAQTTGGETGDRSEPLRLKGPPVETIKVDVTIDATDQLEVADSKTVKDGIQPVLASLETIIYPTVSQLIANKSLAQAGTLEILSMETALTLFVWSKNRITPVRLTEFSVTEEAFDVNLNPIRAKVSLGMRVMSIDDLGFNHKGGNLYMSYQQNKERLAKIFSGGFLSNHGITNAL